MIFSDFFSIFIQICTTILWSTKVKSELMVSKETVEKLLADMKTSILEEIQLEFFRGM